jgi:hypothetical protein
VGGSCRLFSDGSTAAETPSKWFMSKQSNFPGLVIIGRTVGKVDPKLGDDGSNRSCLEGRHEKKTRFSF